MALVVWGVETQDALMARQAARRVALGRGLPIVDHIQTLGGAAMDAELASAGERHAHERGCSDRYRWWLIPASIVRALRQNAPPLVRRAPRRVLLPSGQVGVAVRPRHLRVTFKVWSDEWLTAKERRPGTQQSYEINMRKHIQPEFGNMLLHRIEPTHVQRWIKTLSDKGLAPRTVHLVYKTFRACVNSAVQKRVLPYSPCVGIDLPQVKRKRIIPATREQVWALYEAMPEHSRAMIMVGVGCGLRSGEALGLCLDAIDFESGVVLVRRQVIKVKSRALLVDYNKTETSHDREVPLPEFTRRALLDHLDRNSVLTMPGGEQVLFRSSRGNVFRRDAFYKTFERALAATELPGDFRFHDLRHSFASHALDQGVPEATVQLYMGHASAEELKGTYHHQVKGAAARDRKALEAVFFTETSEVEIPEFVEDDGAGEIEL